ncbi:hypothetical protein FKW77_008014 [Venturia effusa]|uniref:Ketoreductase (KR) domain-containing protein n=1 Tax=Venturia effusa TaxID=50376 RepID=A0A517LKL6_9PEZI|nr:hypothetical protein FKW77_008014 [Venturia effusa]
MLFVVNLLKSQYGVSVPILKGSFESQIVIVTGRISGLGFEAARHAVRLDAAKVILACRTISKGVEARRLIVESTNKTGVIEVWNLDFPSYASVREFDFNKASTLPRLDVLLENAGISTRRFELSEDNESTMSTNILSTFFLAFLLLPRLKETARKYGGKGLSGRYFDALNDERKANMSTRDAVSKLLEILILRQIVSMHCPPGYPVVLNLVAPGFCRSGLAKEMGVLVHAMYYALDARTAELGGHCLILAAQAG